MSDLWYPVTSVHPGPLVQVRAIVTIHEGRSDAYDAEIIASRGKPPHADRWAEWRRGTPVVLPPHAAPVLWQPQAPQKWLAALPQPVPRVAAAAMWSSRGEMLDDAAAAIDGVPASKGDLWWRDAHAIVYEPPGTVSPRMAEGRVMRALAVCGHGIDVVVRTRSFGALLADLAARADHQPYATSDYAPRLAALPADRSDFDTAMAWLTALNPRGVPSVWGRADWSLSRAQEVLAHRAARVPLSFDVIGGLWGISGEAARQAYARSIAAVTRVANGETAWPHAVAAPTRVDHIAAVRARNRDWKRRVQEGAA